jgi:hypothetical protein
MDIAQNLEHGILFVVPYDAGTLRGIYRLGSLPESERHSRRVRGLSYPGGRAGLSVAKLRASKDVYHQFITKKIDTPEKFEEHRLEMAQTVWAQLKASDSATCRSCQYGLWILLHKARMPRRCTKWASRKSKPVLIAIKASPISHLK